MTQYTALKYSENPRINAQSPAVSCCYSKLPVLVVERVALRRGAVAEHRLALVSWLDAALVNFGRVLAVNVVPDALVGAL
jgi:hypothetical protein